MDYRAFVLFLLVLVSGCRSEIPPQHTDSLVQPVSPPFVPVEDDDNEEETGPGEGDDDDGGDEDGGGEDEGDPEDGDTDPDGGDEPEPPVLPSPGIQVFPWPEEEAGDEGNEDEGDDGEDESGDDEGDGEAEAEMPQVTLSDYFIPGEASQKSWNFHYIHGEFLFSEPGFQWEFWQDTATGKQFSFVDDWGDTWGGTVEIGEEEFVYHYPADAEDEDEELFVFFPRHAESGAAFTYYTRSGLSGPLFSGQMHVWGPYERVISRISGNVSRQDENAIVVIEHVVDEGEHIVFLEVSSMSEGMVSSFVFYDCPPSIVIDPETDFHAVCSGEVEVELLAD